jgi:hypothetical protein
MSWRPCELKFSGYGVSGLSQTCQHFVNFRLTEDLNGYRLRLTESRFRYLTESMTISVVLIRKRMRLFFIVPRRRHYLARQHSTTMIYRIGHL